MLRFGYGTKELALSGNLLVLFGMAANRLVLVVDDDAVVLRILSDQIARAGYAVTSAASVVEARRLLNQGSFGVVVADQSMPELSGIEFLRECHIIQPLASRVLVTGNLGLAEVDLALKEGEICRLLIKPWTRFDLISLFDQAYERYELLCERESLRNDVKTLREQLAGLAREPGMGSKTPAGEQAELRTLSEGHWPENDRASREQLLPKARLEALAKVATGIAHEFNNTLIPILGYVELMLEKDQLLENREKARHYLRLVLAAAKDATRVADRLRDVYRETEKNLSEAIEPPAVGPMAQRTVAEPPKKRVRRSLKVLITDDERTSRDLVTFLLRHDHHEVTAASNGFEALQFLRQEPFDLLVTDQEMPGMTGAMLVDAVRKLGNSFPIIMLTGFGELLSTPGATPAGLNLVINKPITMDSLRSALARVFPNDALDETS